MFQLMIAIEDLEASKAMKDLNLERQKIFKYTKCPLSLQQKVYQHLKRVMCDDNEIVKFVKTIYVFETEKKVSNEEIDTDSVDFVEFHIQDEPKIKSRGKITHIFGNIVLVKCESGLKKKKKQKNINDIDENLLYKVKFFPNRIIFCIIQKTLEKACATGLKNFLNNFECNETLPSSDNFNNFSCMNSELEDNYEQQTAIKNIVNRTSFPSPFIIFGGPGTGKLISNH